MSIWREKASGRYRIRIRRRGVDVARELLPAGISRDQAEERHAQLVREVFDRDRLGKQRHSLAEALKRYAEEEIPRLARRDKATSVLAVVLEHTEPSDGLDACGDIARRIAAARGVLSAAARNRPLALLRRVARLAVEWGWLEKAPKIRLEHEGHREEYLSREEAEELVREVGKIKPIAGDWCLIAIYTGMRQGEIESLTKANIRGDTILLKTSKTKTPRTIPILPHVQEPLRRWIDAKDERPKYRALYYVFKQAADKIRRRTLHFHDLRHTTASLLVQAGVDLYTIGELLGSRYAIRRYVHLNTDSKRRAMQRMMG